MTKWPVGDPIRPTEIGPRVSKLCQLYHSKVIVSAGRPPTCFVGLPAPGWTEKLNAVERSRVRAARPARLATSATQVRAAGKQAWGKGVVSMRIRGMWQAIVIVCMLGATGCSKTPTTAPKTVVPPVVVS